MSYYFYLINKGINSPSLLSQLITIILSHVNIIIILSLFLTPSFPTQYE